MRHRHSRFLQNHRIHTLQRTLAACAIGIVAMVSMACAHRHHGHHGDWHDHNGEDWANKRKARASLQALGNSGITGHVFFIELPEGVRVKGHIKGLKPNSVHGFHVHETGDCSAADGSSAGPHFASKGHEQHGAPTATTSHLGDLGNVTSDANGEARIDELKAGATLGDDKDTSFMGRSVIVHDKADDLTSQPAGAAGARVACGVIAVKECKCHKN